MKYINHNKMGDSSNFVIHKFNIERFAAQLQANMGAANSEYTRLMPLTSAAPVWDLHVYDFRAMLNGVAIIAPEQTVYGQNPLSTQSPAPPPHAPLAGSVKDECPNPAVGSDRYLNQPAYLSLGPDTSVNCGILQNYIWNEPREGKTAVMKLVVNKEPNQQADIYLSTMGGGQTGTFNYIVVRDYLCAPDNYQSIVANHGDGVASESYESTIIVQATCGPIEAERRKITFTVIQRAAPGRDDGGVPDGNCFSDYLYWETDPAIGIARWMAGSTPRTDLDGIRGDEDFSTNVHIGCEAGGISTPPGNPVGVINQTRQHIYSTAVGAYSGHDTQGSVCDPLQLGDNPDLDGLLGEATAYGYRSGQSTQQYGATAIGTYAALSNQGALSVALGHSAGVQNNATSNPSRPTRDGTGRSGCATVQILASGTLYISGLATLANPVPPSCPGTGMIVDLTVNGLGEITGISVYQCGNSYCVGAQYDIVQNGNPGSGGRLEILSVGADGVSEATQRARTIVINGSVLEGLNTDGLHREGHPLFVRAPNAPNPGVVWADAFYVKPIREQTYSAQLSRPAGDYRWGLFYNINTGEIVCSETGSPGIPNGNCMSEYLYWNHISGNWEIGGSIDNTGMSDYSVHFGCQAMGGLETDDGYGIRGNDAVAIGVNSAQFSVAPSTRNRATAVGAWSGYSGQGDDAVAIGAAAGLGVFPNDAAAEMTSGRGTALPVDAGADLSGIQPQFQNSIVISGRGYNTNFLPLNTMNPTDVAAASTVFNGTSTNVNQFTVTPPPSGATISVGDLVQVVNGNVSVPVGTYVCSANGNANAVITICNADGTPYDLVGPVVTSITIASSGSGPQPVLDPTPEVAPPGTTNAGGFFVAPLRSSVRNHILSYDTVTKEILYESFPQHNRLNAGDCYSDYLYWSPLAQKWLVGSLKVHIGCGAGGDDATGQESQQGPGCVAVGRGAGHSAQGGGDGGGGRSVAIGVMSGVTAQGVGAVSVGSGISATDAIPVAGGAFAANLGQISQGQYSVSVGCEAGRFSQGQTPGNAGNAVAVGHRAGHTAQGAQAIAIGADAAFTDQGLEGRAIGRCAAYSRQGANATAVGTLAGNYDTNCPPNSFQGDGGANNNIQGGYEANHQPASSIILNAALGVANANVDLNFNYVMFTTPNMGGVNGVFTQDSGHAPAGTDENAAVVSIYNISSGQDLVQAGDRVLGPVVGNTITIEHQNGSVENYPVSVLGYRIIIRNTVASPLMSGNALPLQALSQIGEVGFDAVVPNDVRSPVSGFFVSPIRQVDKNYQLSYDPNTKEVTYQYQKVAPDIGIGVCYSEYLYWDDGESNAAGFPTTPGWYVGGGGAFQPPKRHDLGRIHFGCGAGQYESGPAVVGTRSNPLTIAVGYEAGQFALGWGTNVSVPGVTFPYTDTEGTIAIGYRACHENAFPRGVSIGYEAGRTGQGTAGVYTLNTTAISSGDSCIAIGNQAGSFVQNLGAIAIGPRAGFTSSNPPAQSIGQGAHSVAIGNQAGFSSQGLHAIAIGHQAGCSMINRGPTDGAGIACFPRTAVEAQPANSIIMNAGDPRNGGGEYTTAHQDWGPLQAIAGTSNACGAELVAGGTGYQVGFATTSGGSGSGLVIYIDTVNAGAIVSFFVSNCGNGNYKATPPPDILTVVQGVGANGGTIRITNTENFPYPRTGSASECEALVINNQRRDQNNNLVPMPPLGTGVTGFFVNPVRNVGGGFVMAYNPITKEIKYNASKPISDIVQIDDGDCYSEYLYWDDGLGTRYAGNPGWKIGGTSVTGSDNGRVHIGCRAGAEAGTPSPPGQSVGDRAANLTIAIGLEAGRYGLGRFDNNNPPALPIANDNRGNIAIGYQSGWDRMYPRSVAIGYRAGRVFQGAQGSPDERLDGENNVMDANVAIGNYAGENNQRIGSIAVGALAGNNAQEQFALAVGLQAGRTQQGWHSIALGHKAGFNMPARAPFPPGTFDAQSRNSIIVNAGDPKNTNPTESDWGPLQAISGSSSACGATITNAGTGYIAFDVVGGTSGLATTTGGAGNGFIIRILTVNGGGAIVTFGIVSCGSGYLNNDILTVIQAGSNNNATITLNNREIFPAPSAKATNDELQCILNQGNQQDMPASAGQPVTGFFVNPVRNVGGGFIMAYDPCTKEIKYNASKAIGDLPDLDDGDCYSEYLYWDDGLGTAYAGDPGWKVGGGPLNPNVNPDRGRVHIGCGAGQYQTAGTPGTRAGQRTVAVGFNAGNIAMSDNATAIGENAGATGQGPYAVAVGSLAGSTSQSERGIAIGHVAGQSHQGVDSIAVGFEAGRSTQGTLSVAIGAQAGKLGQGTESVAIGYQAGQTSQSADAVAIGYQAGADAQSADAVAIGNTAGKHDQGQHAIAIGLTAGQTNQGDDCIAIGNEAGSDTQGTLSVAIGRQAGNCQQSVQAVAIGYQAGKENQEQAAVAIGYQAGEQAQKQRAVAIGWSAGQTAQYQLSVAIGQSAGALDQGTTTLGASGSAIAIGNLCSTAQQGANSIAIGYEAGEPMVQRTGTNFGVFPASNPPGRQSVNSIILNSGDPKNVGVNATNDHGPLQAIAGKSNVCAVASISASGTGYSVGSATTTGGTGSGMVVEITSVGAGGTVTGVTIIDCGSGYTDGDTLTLIQAGSGNNATITLSSAETFPTPNPGAGADAILCVNNQGPGAMPPAGDPVTGFFVNPVRNCSGGFVMSYNPCTKEIKYNASKLTDHLPDFDLQSGDCYSEYLYWDDGLGTDYQGDPGWKVGGGPADGTTSPDRGRVHIGCGAGQYQTDGNPGTRAGQQIVAIGYQAGHIAMLEYAVAIGSQAGYTGQKTYAIAVGYQAGQTSQSQYAVAIGSTAGNYVQGQNAIAIGQSAGQTEQAQYAVAIGLTAGQTQQGEAGVAIGYQAGQLEQKDYAVAIGQSAGQLEQKDYAVAIGSTAGQTQQGEGSVAIGRQAGASNQGIASVAVGLFAADFDQGIRGIAIGHRAGSSKQGDNCIAIGSRGGPDSNTAPGQFSQQTLSIAIGYKCGHTDQGNAPLGASGSAIAIGNSCSTVQQGANSIAIGYEAGEPMALRTGTNAGIFPASNPPGRQSVNSIILNSGDPKNVGVNATTDRGPLQAVAGELSGGGNETAPAPVSASPAEDLCIKNQGPGAMPIKGDPVTGFFVNPVRNCSGGFVMTYNPCTKEIKYNASKPIDKIPADIDEGDCYSEYLYWNDGADVVPAGWRKGGGNLGAGAPPDGDLGRIHIGCGAGQYESNGVVGSRSGDRSVAVGYQAGHKAMKERAVAVGESAGYSNQGPYATAVGQQAGWQNQGENAVAVGRLSGYFAQGQNAVAVGPYAGSEDQNNFAVAVGNITARYNQGAHAVAIGYRAAQGVSGSGQGEDSIAVGHEAARYNQGTRAVAIGYLAAEGTLAQGQGEEAVAIGYQAGRENQGIGAIAIGSAIPGSAQSAGHVNQGAYAVAVGPSAGESDQLINAVAIGSGAGQFSQNGNAVAVGIQSGRYNQLGNSVAVGAFSGYTGQKTISVAIGWFAGHDDQGTTGGGATGEAVAIGSKAGEFDQRARSVAVGSECGRAQQRQVSVAIGYKAGEENQGQVGGGFFEGGAVAIGNVAGQTDQHALAIAIGPICGTVNQQPHSIAIGALNTPSVTANCQEADSIILGNSYSDVPAGALCLGSRTSLGPIQMSGQPANATYIQQIRSVGNTGKTLQWNSTTREVSYMSKSFVKEHPVDRDRYLVHACLEGPENGLYYRGKGVVPENEKSVLVQLPRYACLIGGDWTIQLTAQGSFNRFYATEVADDDGFVGFRVFAEQPGKFYWIVHGRQKDKPLETEPRKVDVVLRGQGPYTFLQKR